jgi:hypothetical protein
MDLDRKTLDALVEEITRQVVTVLKEEASRPQPANSGHVA